MGRLKSASAKAKGESLFANSTIGQSLATLDATTQARMRRKFNVCYMMAKENIPFSKYPSVLELEDRHNVDLGPAYRTPDSTKSFTAFIAVCQRNDFLGKLKKCSHFFSILMDGTTDLGNKEEEIVAMVYCYKNEVAQEITSCTRYWSVHSPEKCDANGLLLCFGASLELLGVKSILDTDSVLELTGCQY